MKKILLIALLSTGTLFAQTETNNKASIVVDGTSKTTVTPDMTELNIHLSTIKMTMAEATKSIGDLTQQHLKILKQLGFDEKDVKTTNFSASKNRIYKQNGPIDSGYVVSQNLTLKFPYNQSTLQKVVARFSEVKDPVNFSLGFFVSDALREKTEADLQTKAVLDAKRKADNLAQAAGVKVGSIKLINYGVEASTSAYYKSDFRMMALAEMADGANLSFTPQDVELQETVKVYWYLD